MFEETSVPLGLDGFVFLEAIRHGDAESADVLVVVVHDSDQPEVRVDPQVIRGPDAHAATEGQREADRRRGQRLREGAGSLRNAWNADAERRQDSA